MRSLICLSLCCASVSGAQNVPGSWGGYVSGWTRAEVPVSPRLDAAPRLTPTQQQNLRIQQLLNQQSYFVWQSSLQAQQASAQQDERAAQQLAVQQSLLVEQQRLAREQEFTNQRQILAQQQQVLAQQEQLERERRDTERTRTDATLAEARRLLEQAAEDKRTLEREQDALRQAQARAELDARPRVKGPDINRWVDADGVIHYSTRPQP